EEAAREPLINDSVQNVDKLLHAAFDFLSEVCRIIPIHRRTMLGGDSAPSHTKGRLRMQRRRTESIAIKNWYPTDSIIGCECLKTIASSGLGKRKQLSCRDT